MAYLTEERKKAYMDNVRKGGRLYCPFCRTQECLPELQDGPEVRINDNKVIRIWLCEHCDEAWTDVFTVIDDVSVITDVEYTEENSNIKRRSTMLTELTSIANDLDVKGAYEEAGLIDQVLQAFKGGKEILIRKVAQLAENDQDVVSITPALLLRLMEYAKEEAADDVTLHKVLENVMAQGGTVISRDFENLISCEESEPEAQMLLEPTEGPKGEVKQSDETTGEKYEYQISSDGEGEQTVNIQGEGGIQDIVQTLREVADALDEKGEYVEANLVDDQIVKIVAKSKG